MDARRFSETEFLVFYHGKFRGPMKYLIKVQALGGRAATQRAAPRNQPPPLPQQGSVAPQDWLAIVG
jgi:hypothetical protein